MIGLTLAISFIGAIIAFLVNPVASLYTYFMALFYYPQPLTIPLGTVEFSSGRIIIMGVLANALLRGGQLRRFRPNIIDFWVVAFYTLMSIAIATHIEFSRVLESRGGVFFDIMMPYFAMRIMLNDKEKLYQFIRLTTFSLVPLALMGIFEARTGHNPYSIFSRYYSWGLAGANSDPSYKRMGLFRAGSSLGNYISFGMLFAVMAPLAVALWHDRKWSRMLVITVFGGLMLGLISSMSSGPLFSISVSLAMIPLFRFRDKWPFFAMMVVGCIIFVEAFSNRHFYHVLTLFAFDPETAYYRIGLIEECFGGGMSGHWLFGYGYVGIGPGNDNSAFHWEHQDLTNIYIREVARAGLLALIPYLIVNFLYYKRLYQAAKYATNQSDAWLLWCCAAALVGWNVSMMTVSAMAQIETLLFMFIAMCANMPAIMKAGAEARTSLEPERAPSRVARVPRMPRPARRPRRSLVEWWGLNNV